MIQESAGFLALGTQCLTCYHRINSLFLPQAGSQKISLFLHDITLLGLRMNPKLGLKGSNSSLYGELLVGGTDALLLLLSQFSDVYPLYCGHFVPYCLGLLLTLYFCSKVCPLRFCHLTSSLSNLDQLHIIAFFVTI